MASTDKEEFEGSLNKKYPEVIIFTLSFIIIYLSLLEIRKELLMREHTEQPYIICTSLIGRHNYSSPLMFQCWVMVVVFHNILSFMTELKYISNVTTSICGKCYSIEKGRQFLHEPWIIALA